MKYTFIILLIFFFNSCKVLTNELNNDEIMIMNTIIVYIKSIESGRNSGENDFKICLRRILSVNNEYDDSCGCCDYEINLNKFTYENMVINSKNSLIELEIDRKIIESFIKNNIRSRVLDNNFNSEKFSDDEALDENYNFMTLSNIGFNNKKNEALIHMSIYLPNNISYAKYIYLIKVGKEWNVNKYIYAWYKEHNI